jgi:hypothetical protein
MSRDFEVGSLEIPEFGTSITLEAHNFVCRPLIEVKSIKKFVALVESFPTVCGTPPACKEIRAIPDF